LARLSGIPQATLSAIENDRVRLGVERAKILGRALRCDPAVLVAAYGIIAQSSI
jgi:transcriptional regulator with XRE-family HTH domain